MKKILFILVALQPMVLFSQAKYDYNWILGTWDDQGTQVRFGGDEVRFDSIGKNIEMGSANVTMSDKDGNLIFYSNGCSVQTKNHELMEGGNDLNPGDYHEIWCGQGYPVNQGMLCLPSREIETEYHLFHSWVSNGDYSEQLLYSRIDISANGGDGEVVEKNALVLEDSLWWGYLSAVRHGNGEDWWVIAPGYFPGQFHRLLVDADGITELGEQDLGMDYGVGGWGAAQSVFSPDGTKYVHASRRVPQLLLFDFDRETGLFSNPQELEVPDTVGYKGAAISSNGRFLYVNTGIEMYQYDLDAADIGGSKTLVGEFDGFAPFLPTTFFFMRLAPDCRIYVITGPATEYLHVIDYPNRKGTDCSFRQHTIHLPSPNFRTIPNFPNYRLGTGQPVCDSTIQLVTSTVRVVRPEGEVRVWPNPASGRVNIGLPMEQATVGEWRLYNGMGQLVHSEQLEKGSTEHRAELSGLPPGLYFWEVRSEGERMGNGKLIMGGND